jgi:hypothetical protein
MNGFMNHRVPFVPFSRQFLAFVGSPLPSAMVERLTDVPIDRYVTIIEGQGRIKG